jgi:hypothetical protein
VQVDAPWDEFTAYINPSNPGYLGFGQGANLTPTLFAETQHEIGRGLARGSLASSSARAVSEARSLLVPVMPR